MSNIRYLVYDKTEGEYGNSVVSSTIVKYIKDAEETVQEKVDEGEDAENFIICEVVPIKQAKGGKVEYEDTSDW